MVLKHKTDANTSVLYGIIQLLKMSSEIKDSEAALPS